MEGRNEHNSYEHILKYTGLFGGVQGLNIFIGLVRNKLVALILGPAGMGLVSLFSSTAAFINNATNLGLPYSAVKTLSEIYERDDREAVARHVLTIRTLALITALVGMLICLASSSLIDHFAFSWGNHSRHFALLAPIVGMTAVTGGETAILKALRRLRSLAAVSVINVLAALIISIPIYYMYGESGILPVLTLMAFTQMALTLRATGRLLPYRVSVRQGMLTDGREMVRLGIAFLFSGFFSSGADFVIRSFLNNNADLNVVGLFNAGFMLTTVYAGMVFSAMETDFFPRLSAVNHDRDACNLIINRQIEVSLLLIAPMLTALMVMMPVIVPLLYTERFVPVVSMAQITILALYLRAMKLPVAYLTIAKADSRAFLVLEAYSAVVMIAAVSGGYLLFGLDGTGWGLLITGLIDIVVINLFARFKYGYRTARPVVTTAALHLPVALIAFFVVHGRSCSAALPAGLACCAVSVFISVWLLRKKTKLWNRLKERVVGMVKKIC